MNARVFLQFDKSDFVWEALIDVADDVSKLDAGDSVIAAIGVLNYDLSDHQFVTVKLHANKGKKMTFLLPRHIVRMIAEGTKRDIDKVGFSLPALQKGTA